MRTTQTETAEKNTKVYKISVSYNSPLSPASVVLTLTTFERNGGET
ncbi:MAG: hypothetical protein ACE5RA_01200 [Nitrosopumilus sp.]